MPMAFSAVRRLTGTPSRDGGRHRVGENYVETTFGWSRTQHARCQDAWWRVLDIRTSCRREGGGRRGTVAPHRSPKGTPMTTTTRPTADLPAPWADRTGRTLLAVDAIATLGAFAQGIPRIAD